MEKVARLEEEYANLGVSGLRRLRQPEERKQPIEAAGGRSTAGQAQVVGGLMEKSLSKPVPNARPVISRELLGELCADLSPSRV